MRLRFSPGVSLDAPSTRNHSTANAVSPAVAFPPPPLPRLPAPAMIDAEPDRRDQAEGAWPAGTSATPGRTQRGGRAAMSDQGESGQPYPSAEESLARIHRFGWSTGETAWRSASGIGSCGSASPGGMCVLG
jgi:hypothetical protein